jgi:ankyrin repeat protein
VYIAAGNGHADAIRALCQLGADVNTPEKNYGCTPVYAAACFGHVEAIRALCELGADVNTPAHDVSTPVWIAACNGQTMRTLCELGADINTPDHDGGCTPVLAAAGNGHKKDVKLLHKLGTNINEESNCGTPIELAQQEGHPEVAEKLIKYTSQCQCCGKKATASGKLSACNK